MNGSSEAAAGTLAIWQPALASPSAPWNEVQATRTTHKPANRMLVVTVETFSWDTVAMATARAHWGVLLSSGLHGVSA